MEYKSIAIVITAYKDIENLKYLVDYFNGFSIFIHFDSRSLKNYDKNLINEIKNSENVQYFDSTYEVGWGSFNHYLAIHKLLIEVRKNNEIKYVHIISGQDMPIVSRKQIYSFSCENKNSIYMSCTKFTDISKESIKRRLYCRSLFPKVHLKSNISKFLQIIDFVQYLYPRKKLGNFSENEIYKGMIWSSFPSIFIDEIVQQFKNQKFRKDLEHTRIPEEFILQTIAMNSKFRENVIFDHKRYMLWEFKNGSSPGILDETDYELIINSNNLFARKIDSKISRLLRDKFIDIDS